jgi:hypothetical protein
MRNRRALLLAVVAISLTAVSTGYAYMYVTIAQYTYAAPCGRLTGLPGVLQAANFIPKGDCEVDLGKGGCHDRRECTISNPPSGKKQSGNCTPSADGKNCLCVAKRAD